MPFQKKLESLILVEILLLSLVPTFPVESAETVSYSLASSGSILYVNRYVVALDSSGDFSDIISAVNAVPLGEKWIIEVREGIYDLNPNIRYPYNTIPAKSDVTIIGAGVDLTIIRGFPEKLPAGSNIRSPVIYSEGIIQGFNLEDLTLIQNGSPDNQGWNAIDLRGENSDIVIKNVKITDVTGAAVSIRRFNNLRIEDCYFEEAYTGVSLLGGSNGIVKGNTIIDMGGDGVFPQTFSSIPVYDVMIVDNYMENIGDTGIDITSNNQGPPHVNITAIGNTLINAHVRVSNSHNVDLINNTLANGKSWIDVDSGAGRPIDILIEGNHVTSRRKGGIGLFGAENARILNNVIVMLPPSSGSQTGISAAVWTNLVIEGNDIRNAANYGIDSGGWSIGNNEIVIRNNTILDFGDVGIYDNGKKQGSAVIEDNVICDTNDPFTTNYGLRTDYEANSWVIRYNHVDAGSIAFISAPNSVVSDNVYDPIP
jgi:nitrous oxidase accessory protein NosD